MINIFLVALRLTLFHTSRARSHEIVYLVVNCAQLSSIAFAVSQLNALSIVFLFKLLFTPGQDRGMFPFNNLVVIAR